MAYSAVFKEILREYERDGLAAARKYERELNGLYEKAPRLKEIDAILATAPVSAAKLMLAGPADRDAAAAALKERMVGVTAEKQEILRRLKIPPDWADAVYKCRACKDTGFTGGARCACLRARLIGKYASASNLGAVLKRENFDSFDVSYYSDERDAKIGISPRQNIQKNWTVCLNFVKRFDEQFENIMMYGSTGLGKTFLCNCIAKELLDKGRSVVYVTAGQLCKTVEEFRFNRGDGGEPDVFLEMVNACDLLVIDDLGTEVSTVVTSAELFSILNGRLLSRRHTVISTNLAPSTLEDTYSDRITSRLFGNYTLLRFIGSDIRLRKKYGR